MGDKLLESQQFEASEQGLGLPESYFLMLLSAAPGVLIIQMWRTLSSSESLPLSQWNEMTRCAAWFSECCWLDDSSWLDVGTCKTIFKMLFGMLHYYTLLHIDSLFLNVANFKRAVHGQQMPTVLVFFLAGSSGGKFPSHRTARGSQWVEIVVDRRKWRSRNQSVRPKKNKDSNCTNDYVIVRPGKSLHHSVSLQKSYGPFVWPVGSALHNHNELKEFLEVFGMHDNANISFMSSEAEVKASINVTLGELINFWTFWEIAELQ